MAQPMVAVHCNPIAPFDVLGVWLSPTVKSYLHRNDIVTAPSVGARVMRTMGSGIGWDEWCEHLSGLTPSSALWRAVPRAFGEEARHVLARVVATEAVARREAAG